MQIRHHHDDRLYVIECPVGTVARHNWAGFASLTIPMGEGKEPAWVPDMPSELLPQLAREGRYGLRLLDDPAAPKIKNAAGGEEA